MQRTLTPVLATLTAAILAACSSHEQPVEPVKRSDTPRPSVRAAETPAKVLADYSLYQSALAAAKQGDDILPAQFLDQAAESAMAEEVRNEWLKSLGKRSQWALFNQQYAKLDQAGRAQEVQCYSELNGGNYTALAAELVKEINRLPQGCNRLIEAAAASGRLNQKDAWRRVRGLISNNQITDARNLAAALGSPFEGGGQGAQEYRLISIIGNTAKRSTASAGALESMQGGLTREQSGFAWGVLGHAQALAQNMATAMNYYSRSDRGQLSNEQFEWYARAALRLQRWNELADIITAMPAKLQNDPAWQYWLARSYAAQGSRSRAEPLYEKAAASGRNRGA